MIVDIAAIGGALARHGVPLVLIGGPAAVLDGSLSRRRTSSSGAAWFRMRHRLCYRPVQCPELGHHPLATVQPFLRRKIRQALRLNPARLVTPHQHAVEVETAQPGESQHRVTRWCSSPLSIRAIPASEGNGTANVPDAI